MLYQGQFGAWYLAGKHDTEFAVVKPAIAVNARQRQVMVEKIERLLGGKVKGKTVAFAGLAFKPNTEHEPKVRGFFIRRRREEVRR